MLGLEDQQPKEHRNVGLIRKLGAVAYPAFPELHV